MGVYLAKPKTEKDSRDGGGFPNCTSRYGLTAMQGWRQFMEDAHLAEPSFKAESLEAKKLGVYGVFDGHGGPAVSAWVSQHFEGALQAALSDTKKQLEEGSLSPQLPSLSNDVATICEALQQTFLSLDEMMQKESSREELREIHQAVEARRASSNESAQPQSLLQSLLTGAEGRKSVLRVVTQDGQRFFQLLCEPGSGDDNDPAVFDDSKGEGEGEGEGGDEEEGGAKWLFSKKAGVGAVVGTRESETATASGSSETEEDSAAIDGVTIALDRASSRHIDEKTVERKVQEATEGTEAEGEVKEDADHEMNEAEKNAEEMADDEENMWDDVPDDAEAVRRDAGMPQQSSPFQPEHCGTTAVVAVLIGDEKPVLITANAGDSRVVLCRGGTAIPLSEDHKPGLYNEVTRIHAAGGRVVNGRVDGNLNLSRSIGDLLYKQDKSLPPQKQRISAFPDVRIVPVTPEDEFVVLACDGIWDCMDSQGAVDFIRERLRGHEGKASDTVLSKICEEICDRCVAQDPLGSEGGIGCDNMTLVIVQLNPELACTNAAESKVSFYGVEPQTPADYVPADDE